MGPGRSLGDPEERPDLVVGVALADEPEHLHLAL